MEMSRVGPVSLEWHGLSGGWVLGPEVGVGSYPLVFLYSLVFSDDLQVAEVFLDSST